MLITEIAREAGVCPATVSRAINNPEIVAPESLARIRAVMEANNHVPIPFKTRRGLKSRGQIQRKIGVWFVGAKANNPNLNWFQDQLLQAQSTDTRYAIDLRILFSNSPEELPPNIESDKLDGLILQGMEPSAECIARLRDLPHVWFMTRRSDFYQGDFVEPNNEENGTIAADYLKARGHTSVAVISTDPDYRAVSSRAHAFVKRAAELDLSVKTLLGKPNLSRTSFLEFAPRHVESVTLVKRLIECSPKVTGIYIPVDHFCGAFFRALREGGLQPGTDVDAIIGNYNPMIYHNLDHSPAAIDVHLPTLIRKVVDHILWRIENPGLRGRVGISVSPQLVSMKLV